MIDRCQNFTVELNVDEEKTDIGNNFGDGDIEHQDDSNFADHKFQRAFGAGMVRSEDPMVQKDEMRTIYLEMVRLKGRQYRLPDGPVGRKFVDILTNEIN